MTNNVTQEEWNNMIICLNQFSQKVSQSFNISENILKELIESYAYLGFREMFKE